MVPVLHEEHLLALLYVDSQEPHFCDPHDLERLGKFSRIIAKSVTETAAPRRGTPDAWETYLERTPVEDMEREKLLLLLNRNEWNIARVARMMGVTRRTVYLRLQRYNIPRERVPKSRLKSAVAPRSRMSGSRRHAGRDRAASSLGLAMAVAGAYLLTQRVTVTSGFWSFWGGHTFGLSLLPLRGRRRRALLRRQERARLGAHRGRRADRAARHPDEPAHLLRARRACSTPC